MLAWGGREPGILLVTNGENRDAFDAAVKAGGNPAYWAADGVHPSMAGHALMAKVWRESLGLA